MFDRRHQPGSAVPEPRLFTPFPLRGARARNRVWVSPMCTYSSDDSGRATDFHLVHLGRYALSGAGTVVVEATAVSRAGRISGRDLGLWSEDQVAPLRRVATFLRGHGAVPAIQLAHAGRRAGTPPPWDALHPTAAAPAAADWPVVGPTTEPHDAGRPAPEALDEAGLTRVVGEFAAAARRAVAAGFELVELHGAHGYLLHSFLSPLANTRTDAYGGSPEGRMRFPLRVVAAVRAALGDQVALSYRMSTVDAVAGGLTVEDSVVFGAALRDAGVDVLDCSSGGITAGRAPEPGYRAGFAFHAPYAAEVRARCGLPVVLVGLVVDPEQAEAALAAGHADAVALGRELLHDPGWPDRARLALGVGDHRARHPTVGWWLDLRQRRLDELAAAGETPLDRYRR